MRLGKGGGGRFTTPIFTTAVIWTSIFHEISCNSLCSRQKFQEKMYRNFCICAQVGNAFVNNEQKKSSLM